MPLCGALFLCAASAFGQFTASLDRETIILGEPTVLSLKFENVQPSALPSFPPIPGLQVAGPVSTGVESRNENGTNTSVLTYSVPLTATAPGEYQIPAMTAEVNGSKVQSQPLRLRVLQNDPSAPPAEFANQVAFLWPVLPRKEMFIGEVMVVELRLYLRSEVRRYGELQLPPLRGDGFTGGKQSDGQKFTRRVGNQQFTVIPIYQTVTPVKTGDLELGPLNGSVTVRVVTGGGGNRFFGFDPGDPFGPPTRVAQLQLNVEKQPIRVLPLPEENKPAGFSGAIGSYTLSVTAGPTNVAAGDPITVKIQITGRGYLDGIAMPDLGWKDFKTFPPTVRTETTDALGMQGTRFFEQLVTPQSADIREIPPISFSYFDPEAKAFRTLTQPAIPITVRPGGVAAAPTVAAARNNTEKEASTQDIVPIKQRFGPVAGSAEPLLTRPWFLAAQSLPALAFVGALFWRKRNESWESNPRLRRKRMTDEITRNGLEQMKRLAAQNDSEQFFATGFRLLQEQIGERLNVPGSAITEAVVEESLRPRGVPEDTLQAADELFQICNQARYAPLKSSQEFAAVIPKFEEAIAKLKEVEL